MSGGSEVPQPLAYIKIIINRRIVYFIASHHAYSNPNNPCRTLPTHQLPFTLFPVPPLKPPNSMHITAAQGLLEMGHHE